MKDQTIGYGRRLLLEGQLPHLAREKENARRDRLNTAVGQLYKLKKRLES